MGSRDGGAFEIPFASVTLLAPEGRIRRLHCYGLDQLDAARACFAALTSDPPALRIENAATRAADRVSEAWAARDWKRQAELFPAGFRCSDRRRLMQLELDRDQFLEWMRTTFEMSSSRLEQQVLATRGDRLALSRDRVEVADQNLGPSEIESLSIIEVDDHGESIGTVRFDSDDLAAAYAELDQRYAAGEGARGAQWAVGDGSFSGALAARDWDALTALCAPELVVYDHRLLGWEPLRGRTAYIESVKALFDLAPDAHLRIDHLICSEHGELVVSLWLGTREGGAFEMPRLVVIAYDGLRGMSRIDGYDPEQLDEARARFAELRPDPTRIRPNAATHASDRCAEALVACDWDALRALVGDEFRYEDRSRRALVSGDVEMWIASVMFLVSEGADRAEREVLGTVGDRIALDQIAWRSASDATRFELDWLRIIEVNAEGKLRAFFLFDPDDRRAAFAEAQARFAAGEAAAIGGQAPIAALVRALGQHDWESLRGALAPDAAICDRRAFAIMGEVDREQWIDSLRTLVDLAPDVDWELSRLLAWNRHGRVGAGRRFGTARDGGPFEDVFVAVLLTRGEHVQRYEFFDVGDADRAIARFEALCKA
jgi:ketosteroid isomerase-like protein